MAGRQGISCKRITAWSECWRANLQDGSPIKYIPLTSFLFSVPQRWWGQTVCRSCFNFYCWAYPERQKWSRVIIFPIVMLTKQRGYVSEATLVKICSDPQSFWNFVIISLCRGRNSVCGFSLYCRTSGHGKREHLCPIQTDPLLGHQLTLSKALL